MSAHRVKSQKIAQQMIQKQLHQYLHTVEELYIAVMKESKGNGKDRKPHQYLRTQWKIVFARRDSIRF
jgi:hypothetical protein